VQDLKRPTLDRKETDFLSCKSKTENFGLSPDFRQAKRIENISLNKTKRIHCVENYSDGNNRTERNQIFLGFKPKPKIYFSRPDQI
jgi:hypothetical protein